MCANTLIPLVSYSSHNLYCGYLNHQMNYYHWWHRKQNMLGEWAEHGQALHALESKKVHLKSQTGVCMPSARTGLSITKLWPQASHTCSIAQLRQELILCGICSQVSDQECVGRLAYLVLQDCMVGVGFLYQVGAEEHFKTLGTKFQSMEVYWVGCACSGPVVNYTISFHAKCVM